ncbi:MAG TPA: universal stress protein, partial [Actinomycetes bacterium]|nr:universal stress protein [Actinomycetes bacterium]
MTEQNPRPIVVAVGHDPIDGALAFAAGQAVRSGCDLHLVHVVHLLAQGPEMPLVAETDLERAGRKALNAALERANDIGEGVSVTAELRVGGVVPTLVDIAKDARMIVLERRELSSMMRVVTRSVSSGVAARARVPVVSVPSH